MNTTIIMLGPPGVGKGTQSAWLAQRIGVPAISTGQIFRDNIANDTELGRLADRHISKGEFVPDPITTPMVAIRLAAPDVAAKGFVLDGYPRTLKQAHDLRDILAVEGIELDLVLEFSAPKEVLVERVIHRAAKEHRSDDTAETFRKRLNDYYELTEPLATYYADQDLLEVIDATGTPAEVSERMLNALKARNLCDANLQVQ